MRFRDCECRVLSLDEVPRALANHDTRGAVKMVADANTGKLLGAHAVAEGAGEMMLAATYAIRAGMTVDDIADTWAPYLTMAERPFRRRSVPQPDADLLLRLRTTGAGATSLAWAPRRWRGAVPARGSHTTWKDNPR